MYCHSILRQPKHLRVAVAALLLVLAPMPLRATDNPELDEDQIKAGYLINFIRFVEWPERMFPSATSPITVCIVGDTPVASLVAEAAAGKVIGARAVHVRHPRASDDLHFCHLVFVDATEARSTERLLESLKGSAVLTVGESPGFAQSGGVINFFDQENKVRLEINPEAGGRAGLKISARLLAVSRLVNDKPKEATKP